MLILPTVLITLSGIGGAGGIALSAKGMIDSIEASATNRMAQERNDRNLWRFEAFSNQLNSSLENLGKQRLVITKNFKVFIDAFEKIHNRPQFEKRETKDFPVFDFEEISNVSVVAGSVLGATTGAVSGSVLAAAAATGTTNAVIALGTASTGTKIATLHGAAQIKAALATLGGGAIAKGGGGIALGKVVLNAASAGVAVLFEGIAMAYTGSIAKKEADKAKGLMLNNEEIINDAINMQIEITLSADKMNRTSVELSNKLFKPLVLSLKSLVSFKDDWNDFTEEERQLVENNVLIVQILHYLNNTPLYVAKQIEDDGTIDTVESNKDEADIVMNKARHAAERIF